MQLNRQQQTEVAVDGFSSQLACWCGRGQWRWIIRTPRIGLLRCSACGCYRNDPVPVSSSEDAESFYSDYYQTSTLHLAPKKKLPKSTKSDRRFWRVTGKAPELLQVRQRVVDIGCGGGGLCAELAQDGWPDVIGLDISRARIERARARHPGIRFHDCPLDRANIEPCSVDLAILDNVIEHVLDPPKMLREIRHCLSDDGRLALMTPNMESGNFRLLGRRWTPELAPHTHVFLFTKSCLQEALELAGFEVIRIGFFHPEPLMKVKWSKLHRKIAPKQFAWKSMQFSGALYGLLTGSPAMLYAVAKPSRTGAEASGGDETQRPHTPKQ